jgi:hypothetical protein
MYLWKLSQTENRVLAPGSQLDWTLDILPTSHLDFIIRFLNNGVNVYTSLANILAAITNINVALNGTSFFNGNLADLFRVSTYLTRNEPVLFNIAEGDNAARGLILRLPFGRRAYNPDECMPGNTSGAFTAVVTAASAFTNLDTIDITLQQCTLPGASPKNTVRATSQNFVTTASDNDVAALPIGAKLLAALIFSPTVPVGTSFTTTVRKIILEVNDETKFIANLRWESLRANWQQFLGAGTDWAPKIHRENTAAAYAQNASTAGEQVVAADTEQYGLLDFSPTQDDSHLLDLTAASTARLKITSGDAQTGRILPIQLYTAAQVAAINRPQS